MNDEAVYRTAPATPGLLYMSIYLFSSLARIWSPEYEDSSGQLGAGEDVEEAEAEKGHDVFDVVLVGAAQPLLFITRV
jgi:hypothetical protein